MICSTPAIVALADPRTSLSLCFYASIGARARTHWFWDKRSTVQLFYLKAPSARGFANGETAMRSTTPLNILFKRFMPYLATLDWSDTHTQNQQVVDAR